MKCPSCEGTLVMKKSYSRIGYHHRERQCRGCGATFSTYEVITPTIKGGLATLLHARLRETVALTMQFRTTPKEAAVQLRRRVVDGFALKKLLAKRTREGKTNSLMARWGGGL